MQYTLIGGIKYRKKRFKEYSSAEFAPTEVSIFLRGATPCLSVGDLVKKGEPVAKDEEGLTVFASVTGEITSFDDGFITILAKHEEQNEVPLLSEYTGELNSESRPELAKYLLSSGHPDSPELDIRRDFGNTKRVILNCISSQNLQDAEKIIDGAKIILLAIGIRNAIIAISKKDKKLARAIEKCRYDRNMFLVAMLPISHPLESPVALRSALLPYSNDNDCLVLSPAACIAAYEAVANRKPFLGHRVSLVYKRASYSVFCPQGTMIKDLKEYLGSILKKNASSLSVCTGISGIGIPLADNTVIGEDITVLSFKKKPLSDSKYPSVCISCGKCKKVCPAKLSPYLLYREVDKGSVQSCISCACCSMACPSGIPLAEKINKLKWEAYYEN